MPDGKSLHLSPIAAGMLLASAGSFRSQDETRNGKWGEAGKA